MWKCKHCGEECEDAFDSCWKCTTPAGQELPLPKPSVEDAEVVSEKKTRVPSSICKMCGSKVGIWSRNFTGETICQECTEKQERLRQEQEKLQQERDAVDYGRLPQALLEKYIGKTPPQVISLVYWGVGRNDHVVQNMIAPVVAGAVAGAVGAVLASGLGRPFAFLKDATYTGHLGLLAAVGETLISVDFGEIPFKDERTPSLSVEHLRCLLEGGSELEVKKAALSEVWCSAEKDNVLRVLGALDLVCAPTETYPAKMIGAISSTREFVSTLTNCDAMLPPKTLLELLGSNDVPQGLRLAGAITDSGYMRQFLRLLVELPKSRREPVLAAINRLPRDTRTAFKRLFQNEADNRMRDRHLAFWAIGIAGVCFVGSFWLAPLIRDIETRGIWQIWLGLLSVAHILISLRHFVRSLGSTGFGSAKWLCHAEQAIVED